MTGSVALDVVIGLVFIYLLYSLLATIIQEAVANLFNLRAKFLKKAIIRMLEDGKAKVANDFLSSLGSFFSMFLKNKDHGKIEMTKAFYAHPLIKYLAEDDHHNKPSYLTAQNFSKTIIDLLRGNDFNAGDDPKTFIAKALKEGKIQWKHPEETDKKNDTADKKENEEDKSIINKETLSYLRSLWADAQGDVNKFETLVENWFDITMERTTGWYKKHTQGVLLMIGLTIAMIFNVDTIKIIDTLSKDPDLRKQMVEQASNYVATHKVQIAQADTSKNQELKDIKKKADSLLTAARELVNKDIANVNKSLAIGWTCQCTSTDTCRIKCVNKKTSKCTKFCLKSNLGPGSPIGWLITAFALSLGAPFWFDTLNKLMKLRGAINSGDKEKENAKNNDTKNIKAKG